MHKWALLLGGDRHRGHRHPVAARRPRIIRPGSLVVVVGYVASFCFLTPGAARPACRSGVAYGIWGALGTAATAGVAAIIFGDPFTTPIIAGHRR